MSNQQDDILTIIKSRRSIRSYTSKIIEDEKLNMILEAGRWAPSARNNQPWRFIVITDQKIKNELASHGIINARFNHHLSQAPVVLAVCAENTNNRWVEVDCGLASENIMLAAWALGIGSCFIGAFDEIFAKQLLGLAENMKIIGLITLGYPAEKPKPTPRLDLDQIVTTDKQIKMIKSDKLKSGILSLMFK